MFSVVLLLLVASSTAIFNVELKLQAHTPVTVALPSSSPPWLLSSSAPLSLSLSPCPLSKFPTSVVSKESLFSVFLDENRVNEIIDKGRCGNDSQNTLFATVVSRNNEMAMLEMRSISKEDNITKPISLDGSAQFSVKKLNYATFTFDLPSIEHGINLKMGLDHGIVEIFATFCVDLEGLSLGKIEYPAAFNLFLDSARLVQLIESYSCDNGALYHNLERSPPHMIIRMRSADASGAISVSMGEISGSHLQRSGVEGKAMDLEANDTITFDYPIGTAVNFSVVDGSVEVSATTCNDSEERVIGTYQKGSHSIAPSQLQDQSCNQFSSVATVTWTALEYLTIQITPPPEAESPDNESPEGLPWYTLAAIVGLCSIAVVFLCCVVHALSKMRQHALERRKIEEEKTQNIPMDSNWM